MAATAITGYSVELAASLPTNQNYAPNKPNEDGGTVRRAYFTYAQDGNETTSTIIAVAKIPKGARLYGGHVWHDDLGSSIDLDFGIAAKDGTGEIDDSATSDDVDFFTSVVITCDSAGSEVDIGRTLANNWGYETQKEVWVTMKYDDATSPTAAADVAGYIEYVID